MAGKNKVKRYKKIYDNSSQKKRITITTLTTALVCGVVIYVGYILFGVYQDYKNGNYTYVPPTESNNTSESNNNPSEVLNNNSVITESSNITVSQPNESNITNASRTSFIQKMNGVYMPVEYLKNDQKLNGFIKNAVDKDFNTIVFDLKDILGNVHYLSESEEVKSANAIANDAVDLKVKLDEIKKAGITPVVRIYAFQDDKASRVLPNSYVMYGNSETRWLDNSPANGGKSWLNPESNIAQQYIISLVKDISSYGVEYIILDSVQYPSGLALNQAYFGEKSKTDKLGVLKDFSNKLENSVKDSKTSIIFMSTANNQVFGNNDLYGGNPLNINKAAIATSILPSSLDKPFVVENVSVDEPTKKPFDATKLIISKIQETSSQAVILPFIQYFDGYESGGAAQQVLALEEKGINCHILYNTQGIY